MGGRREKDGRCLTQEKAQPHEHIISKLFLVYFMATATSTVIVQVERRERETTASLIRRFSKRAQQAKIVSRARALRSRSRRPSEETKKKSALRRIEKSKIRERLYKLGKVGKTAKTKRK